ISQVELDIDIALLQPIDGGLGIWLGSTRTREESKAASTLPEHPLRERTPKTTETTNEEISLVGFEELLLGVEWWENWNEVLRPRKKHDLVGVFTSVHEAESLLNLSVAELDDRLRWLDDAVRDELAALTDDTSSHCLVFL